MIVPNEVKRMAYKKEKENLRFRVFLKCNADEDELDQLFFKYHKELFENYDCNLCRNCCKEYHGSIPNQDLKKDAEHLHMSKANFISKYLVQTERGTYETKHQPCDFLENDGSCRLGECKPENCEKYPYTNQPGRLFSLYSVFDVTSVCPVAYEILERIKIDYGFKKK